VRRERETSLEFLPKYLLITKFRFDAMLCSILGDKNYDAGRIKCSRRTNLAWVLKHTTDPNYIEKVCFISSQLKNLAYSSRKIQSIFWLASV